MKMRNWIPLALAALALVMGEGCNRVEAAETKSMPTGAIRGSIELIIYAADFGQVRETRDVKLEQGRNLVGITDVSKTLDQDTVLFSWLEGKGAKVVSSTYDLGMNDASQLLKRFLGREVELVYRGENGKEGDRQKGILLVADPGNVVVKVGDNYVMNPTATIEAPANQGIVTIPQLAAEVDSGADQQARMNVSYMTTGLSWNADYTVTLRPDSDVAALECWATVLNRTGVDYPNARISFVAGSPNRAVRDTKYERTAGAPASMDSAKADMEYRLYEAQPQAMGELYAYPYTADASIKQDQVNRVRMMNADAVKIQRDYAIRLPYEGYGWGNPNQRFPATLSFNIKNDKASGLGDPLPAGSLRVYEPDKGGQPQYIGAATISDSPKDAMLNVTLTNVFDVYATGRLVETKQIDKKQVSTTYEVSIQNQKNRPVSVRLVQGFGGNWSIAQETHRSVKLNGNSAQWTIDAASGGETFLRYTVIRKY